MGKSGGSTPRRGRSPKEGKETKEQPSRSDHTSPDATTLADSAQNSAPQTPRKSSFDRVQQDGVNEQSPLLQPSETDGDSEDDLLEDDTVLDSTDDYQLTKSTWYLIILTVSLAGLQIAWSVELSNGSPYLLSLGISKSLMALVWIAGPLSGTLVQPYVGIKSDNCRVSWGKRKPFMLGGALATIISLLCLAWTRELVGGFLGYFGADREAEGTKVTIIVVAVLFVYILDFSINTIQAAIRAFMVDCAPTHQQEAANAMASRMTGIGNIIGYCFGYINLPRYMWFFGDTQFKVLCVIASIALGGTVLASILLVKERDPNLEGPPTKDKGGVVAFFKGVFGSIKRLPPQTRKVCEVQFFAWIGWFGFLFYLSTWVAELYVHPIIAANPDQTPEEIEKLYEKGTRIGTFALLVWASASLISNLLLPFFVAPSYSVPVIPSSASQMNAASIRSGNTGNSNKSYTTAMDRFLEKLVIPWLTLRRAWTIGLVLFAICMFSTLLIPNPWAATIVVGIVGIPWSLTIWAPFAIISSEISKRDALRRAQALNLTHNTTDPLAMNDNGDQAGVILGIHNVAIAAPQVIATLGSSVIFKFLQKPRGSPNADWSMPVVLATGGIFAGIAAYMASQLAEEGPVESLEAVRSQVERRGTGERRSSSAREHRMSLSRSHSFSSYA